MTLVFDILHFVAAALLAVIGFGYEREEECDPVHFQPAHYTIEASSEGRWTLTADRVHVTGDALIIPASDGATPASDCDNGDATIVYPVL